MNHYLIEYTVQDHFLQLGTHQHVQHVIERFCCGCLACQTSLEYHITGKRLVVSQSLEWNLTCHCLTAIYIPCDAVSCVYVKPKEIGVSPLPLVELPKATLKLPSAYEFLDLNLQNMTALPSTTTLSCKAKSFDVKDDTITVNDVKYYRHVVLTEDNYLQLLQAVATGQHIHIFTDQPVEYFYLEYIHVSVI